MWCHKQDTGDTRETPAISVCQGLIEDGAMLNVYDPQVSKGQVISDLSAPKFTWDHPVTASGLPMHFSSEQIEKAVTVCDDPYQVNICVLTSTSCSSLHARARARSHTHVRTLVHMQARQCWVLLYHKALLI